MATKIETIMATEVTTIGKNDFFPNLSLLLPTNILTKPTTSTNTEIVPLEDTSSPDESKVQGEGYTQWAIGDNSRYSPVGRAVTQLPAGIYEPYAASNSYGLERVYMSSDQIYELPDMSTNIVIQEAETFWASEAKYRKHNLLYKRGIILYGPAGSGKTVTVKLLMDKLIKRNGIVMLVTNIQLATVCLKALRRIEPTRNIIAIFEDIDEIMSQWGEAQLLSLLDGENNIDRIFNIATTNYPDRLGPRIINRPSRFDRRVKVGMPSDEDREYYLRKTTNDSLTPVVLATWIKDTKGMSIAHLRELVAAVYCLDQSYREVISRLRNMALAVKTDDEFERKKFGFANKTPLISFSPTSVPEPSETEIW